MIIFLHIKVLRSGLLEPADLPDLVAGVREAAKDAEEAVGRHLIVLSGLLPEWGFAALSHDLLSSTAVPAVAICDYERFGGKAGVVALSRSPDYKVGDIVALDGEDVLVVDFPFC